MQTIKEYLSNEHKKCDELFAQAEESASKGDWDNAALSFEEFKSLTLHHFNKEERVMFVLFEQRTGMSGGPTQVMRMEHEQIRRTLETMSSELPRQEKRIFLGLCETLNLLIQQHNAKEEQILYTMSDNVFDSDREDVISQMQELPRQ